ncbi:MAG: serine/threonine protein kinase [Fimbriiglobus sp.]
MSDENQTPESGSEFSSQDETKKFEDNNAPKHSPEIPKPPVGNRYRMVRQHAHGGLGEIWYAFDELLGRYVALKTLRGDRARIQALHNAFQQEAHVTSCLEHPNIAPVYDFIPGEGDQSPWYSMRFLEGDNLSKKIRAYHAQRYLGRADSAKFRDLLDVFVIVCRALGYAHEKGVIHRDIKGDNIIVGHHGEVFVVDWGLAKFVNFTAPDEIRTPYMPTNVDDTVQGTVKGTPAYMAPEQAIGHGASKATDIYALGGLLYSILTGKAPIEGSTAAEILERVAMVEPTAPHLLNGSCPGVLEAICRKAMNRNPKERYLTASELADDVRQVLADAPIVIYQEPLSTRAFRWAKLNRTIVATVLGVGITALFGTSVAFGISQRERARTEQNFQLAKTFFAQTAEQMTNQATNPYAKRPDDEKRLKTIQETLDGLAKFVQEDPTDQQLRLTTARLHRYAAKIQTNHNQISQAQKHFEESSRYYDNLIVESPESAEYIAERLELSWDIAGWQAVTGELKTALDTIRTSEERAQILPKLGLASDKTQRTEAVLLLESSALHRFMGDLQVAEQKCSRAIELFDTMPSASDTDVLLGGLAARERADTYATKKQYDLAVREYRDAIHRFTNLSEMEDAKVSRASAQLSLGATYLKMKDPTERAKAEAEITAASLFLKDFYRSGTTILLAKQLYATWLVVEARQARLAKKYDVAEKALQDAEKQLGELLVKTPQRMDYRLQTIEVCVEFYKLYHAKGDTKLKAKYAQAFQTSIKRAQDRNKDYAEIQELKNDFAEE